MREIGDCVAEYLRSKEFDFRQWRQQNCIPTFAFQVAGRSCRMRCHIITHDGRRGFVCGVQSDIKIGAKKFPAVCQRLMSINMMVSPGAFLAVRPTGAIELRMVIDFADAAPTSALLDNIIGSSIQTYDIYYKALLEEAGGQTSSSVQMVETHLAPSADEVNAVVSRLLSATDAECGSKATNHSEYEIVEDGSVDQAASKGSRQKKAKDADKRLIVRAPGFTAKVTESELKKALRELRQGDDGPNRKTSR